MAENVMAIENEAFAQSRPVPSHCRPEDDITAQIAKAITLLGVANGKGIRVPEDVVATVFTVREAQEREQRLDAAVKTRFWNAYSVLQNIIKPAARARRLYRIVFYITLILLLATQCYFTVGAVTRDQIQRINQELFTLSGQLAAVEGTSRIAGDLQGKAAQQSGTEPVLQERIKQLGVDRLAFYQLAERLTPFLSETTVAGTGDFANRVAQSLRLAALSLTLDFLAKYVLPALYGLLGACAFVLRQLSDEIGRLRFAYDRQVQYTLRLNIGMLGGLAIGWFINPGESGSVVASLSPLALAFVAGYGSDLLFALLDRIVAAFVTPRDDALGKTVEERVGGLERVRETRVETRVADGRPAEADQVGPPASSRSATEERARYSEQEAIAMNARLAAA